MAILPSLALLIVGMLMIRVDAGVPKLRCTFTENAGGVVTAVLTITATTDATHNGIATYLSDTDVTTTNCATSTPDSGVLTLPIITIVDRAQTVPAIPGTDCQVNPGAAADKVEIRVVGQSTATEVKTTDKFYIFDFNHKTDCNGNEITAVDNTVTVTVTPADGTLLKDVVEASLVKPDGSPVPPGGPALDNKVKIQVKLTRTADAADPLGVFIHDLTAADKNDLNTAGQTVAMSNEHGCKQTTNGGAFQMATEFVPVVAAPVAGTATEFITRSGEFDLAIFLGSSMVIHFFMKYEVCFVKATLEDKCFDPAAHCTTATGRRRRSATQPSLNGTATLEVRVRLGNVGDTASQGGNDRNAEECKTARDFWVVAIVLGCLLLAVLLFAVFLFYRLKSEQRRTDKIDQKFGAQNPAF